MSAHRCELDHRVPFRPDGTGGTTSDDNLGALCKADHLLKTHAGWTLTKDDSGTYTWTTPTGHTYPYRPAPAPGHEPPPSGWDDEPADGAGETGSREVRGDAKSGEVRDDAKSGEVRGRAKSGDGSDDPPPF